MKPFSRRDFIKNTGGAGIAFWLGISLTEGCTVKSTDATLAKNFTPYILVNGDGSITIFNTKPEMGQGTFQSIPALIAEELEVSLDQVTIKTTMVRKNSEINNAPAAVHL